MLEAVDQPRAASWSAVGGLSAASASKKEGCTSLRS